MPIVHDHLVAVLLYFDAERGGVPALVWLTLLIAIYLAVLEVRPLRIALRLKLWWVSLVFLTHFFGYLALRGWVLYRRRRGEPVG
jgi:hypothetical protein